MDNPRPHKNMIIVRNQIESTTSNILGNRLSNCMGRVPNITPTNVDKELERLKLQVNAELIQNKESKMGDSRLS